MIGAADQDTATMALRSDKAGDATMGFTFSVRDPSGMTHSTSIMIACPDADAGTFYVTVDAQLYVIPRPEPEKSLREKLFDILESDELVDQVLSIAGINDDDDDVYDHVDWKE